MLNNKRYKFFNLQKEQIYLKKLIEKNPQFAPIYNEFIKLSTKEDFINFSKKYNLSDISKIEDLNKIREILAYDLNEIILKA